MRSVAELLAALGDAGLPFTQLRWSQNKAPELPYVVIVPNGSKNVFADGVVAATPVSYLVELYTRERDVPLEKRVQASFLEHSIPWQRYHTSDDDGPVVITVYQMTLTE